MKDVTPYQAPPRADPNDKDFIIREMADTIRNMDQLIYDMSQKLGWEQMRPLFLQLLDGTMYRKRRESDRIADIMRKELISVYTKPGAKS